MNKEELIQRYKTARESLSEWIKLVPDQAKEEVPISGYMSLKDILFHVNWFDNEMIQVLESRIFHGSPWWELDTDERNKRIQEQSELQDWHKTYNTFEENSTRLLKALENLEEAAINDPGYFEDMPEDWSPWFILSGNTYDHYDHHARDIEEYIQQHEQQA